MGQILYPPNILDIPHKIIFLAGSIQGAYPWQEEAAIIIW